MSGNFVGVHFLTWTLQPRRFHSVTGLVCYTRSVKMDYIRWKHRKRHEAAAAPQHGSACTLPNFVPALLKVPCHLLHRVARDIAIDILVH